jgi:hypothetical protein
MRGRMPDSFVDQPARGVDAAINVPFDAALAVAGYEELIETLVEPAAPGLVEADPAAAADPDNAPDIVAVLEEAHTDAAADAQADQAGEQADADETD